MDYDLQTDNSDVCPKCGEKSLIYTHEGIECLSCGYTKF